MKPISPVVIGAESSEVVFAKDQPEYIPLPALPIDDGERVITRWRMAWRERLQVLLHGDVYLWISTFRKPLQPVALTVEPPEIRPTYDWPTDEVRAVKGHIKEVPAT